MSQFKIVFKIVQNRPEILFILIYIIIVRVRVIFIRRNNIPFADISM